MDHKQIYAPHFFKIIDPQIVQKGTLMIPNEFVKKYGKDLSDHVYLNVPNGDSWMVKLMISSNGKVYLEDGWKEFAEHYSIGLYHFLVFRYQQTLHFHVLIFDRTSASEIEYPSLHKESQVKRKGLVVELPPMLKKKKCNSMHKQENYEGGGGSKITQVQKMKKVKLHDHPSFHFLKVGDGTGGSVANTYKTQNFNIGAKSKGMLSDAEAAKEIVVRSANAFTSENPFFMAMMNRWFMKCNVIVPRSIRDICFSTKTANERIDVMLVVSGRSWRVVYDASVKKFGKGWAAFARDNRVEIGDVCVFELMKGSEYFFNVVIFRA